MNVQPEREQIITNGIKYMDVKDGIKYRGATIRSIAAPGDGQLYLMGSSKEWVEGLEWATSSIPDTTLLMPYMNDNDRFNVFWLWEALS